MRQRCVRQRRPSHQRLLAPLAAALLLLSCGGSDDNFNPGGGPPPYSAVPQVKVSQPNALPVDCDGVAAEGTLYQGTALEPQIAVNAQNRAYLIAVWQQNRWSSGGSQAIAVSSSVDGGNSWVPGSAPTFSRCSGGGPGNVGDYARASNPWVSYGPGGTAYALALAFTGDVLQSGSSSAMLVSSSLNGGLNWMPPIALIQDGANFFNDKGAITADPNDFNYVYVVWDRLDGAHSRGPSYFALTANANSTWSVPRAIWDPGVNNQTINNIIVVTPDGMLIDLFNEIDNVSGASTSHLKAIRSSDHGTTWSVPILVADMEGVGTADPNNQNGVRDAVLLFSAAVGPDGTIYVAWQDARFASGNYDGIALASSHNDGLNWSTPVQVNGDPTVPAFTPTVAVSPGGRSPSRTTTCAMRTTRRRSC
jgi:hypothetical protein